jgi:hypothetical protein
MSVLNNKIIQLKDDLDNICLYNKCDKYSEYWMWGGNNMTIGYYYLIYVDNNNILHYNDIEDVKIELSYDNNNNKYRIDIRSKFNLHNLWFFDDDKWSFVDKYVKDLVQIQYDKTQKINELISLSGDAHNDIEPHELYKAMKMKIRKEKIEKLNEER